MKVITAPNEIVIDGLPTIFLAGGITDCEPWQTVVIEGFRYDSDAILLNPRRKTFSIHKPEESRKQIEWEFDALTNCDIFTMWFAGGKSVQPICMYELGRYVTLKYRKLDRIVIGVDRNYLCKSDVLTQMRLIDPKLADKISFNIEDHISNIKMALKQLQKDVYTYPSGFKVGDKVRIVKHSEKYNRHITNDIDSIVTIIEPLNPDDWPEDAVEIEIEYSYGGKGIGTVDADSIEKM